MEQEPRFVDCPDCDGRGWTCGISAGPNGEPEPEQVPCWPCGGTGEREVAPQAEQQPPAAKE